MVVCTVVTDVSLGTDLDVPVRRWCRRQIPSFDGFRGSRVGWRQCFPSFDGFRQPTPAARADTAVAHGADFRRSTASVTPHRPTT